MNDCLPSPNFLPRSHC